jgi:hypothetical protein
MAAAHMEPAALYTPVMAKQKGLGLQKITERKIQLATKMYFFMNIKIISGEMNIMNRMFIG